MMGIRTVLCAMERGDEKSEAVREAEAIASANGAELAFFLVTPSDRVTPLLGRARALGADLIVVNAAEPGAPDGGLAEAVVRHSPCAVLVARPSPHSGKVLVASDLAGPTYPAVGTAVGEARRRKAKIFLVHDVDTRIAGFTWGVLTALVEVLSDGLMEGQESAARERMAEALRRFGAEGERLVVNGAPGAAVLKLATTLPAELVVVGSSGESSVRTLLVGSVVESVVHWAPCAVLVVPARGPATRPLPAHAEAAV
jgi:nucleotide-binding universal stress UspA family protein